MKILINFTILIFTVLLSACSTVKKEQAISFIPQEKEEIIGYVNKDFLEVYTSVNKSKVVSHLQKGTKILITDSQGDLVNISNNPQYPSWVKAEYICFTEECWVKDQLKKSSVSHNDNSKQKTITQKSTSQTKVLPQAKQKTITQKPTSQTKVLPQAKQKNQAPSGATAKCKDGTLSFSKTRRGTCSRHGGVATWF